MALKDVQLTFLRWGNEEVTLQDMLRPDVVQMAGYAKMTGCCRRAAEDGYQYVWIDTCW